LSKLVYLYLQMAVKILDATEEDTLEFDIAATDIAVASEMADYATGCGSR